MTADITLEDVMTRVNAGRKGSLAGQWLEAVLAHCINTGCSVTVKT